MRDAAHATCIVDNLHSRRYVDRPMPQISDALDSADFIALNICRTDEGWQASLERTRGSFSIGHGETVSAAVAAVLGVETLPPCPVALP